MCRSPCWDVLFDAPCSRTLPRSETFRYGECAACGSLTLLDEVDPSSFYLSGYERHGLPQQHHRASQTMRAIGLIADRLIRPAPVPRHWWWPGHPTWLAWFRGSDVGRHTPILDVVCGSGALLVHLARFGFTNLHGIDPFLDDTSLDLGTVRLRRAHLCDEGDRYGAIIFNHSLEHVDDPLDQLRLARELLNPNGVIIVDLPIAGGRAWSRFRENWAGLDAPLHRLIPTPAGMSTLADSAGLRVVRWHGSTALYFYSTSLLIQLGAAPDTKSDSQQLDDRVMRWCSKQAAGEKGADASQASFVLTTR